MKGGGKVDGSGDMRGGADFGLEEAEAGVAVPRVVFEGQRLQVHFVGAPAVRGGGANAPPAGGADVLLLGALFGVEDLTPAARIGSTACVRRPTKFHRCVPAGVCASRGSGWFQAVWARRGLPLTAGGGGGAGGYPVGVRLCALMPRTRGNACPNVPLEHCRHRQPLPVPDPTPDNLHTPNPRNAKARS